MSSCQDALFPSCEICGTRPCRCTPIKVGGFYKEKKTGKKLMACELADNRSGRWSFYQVGEIKLTALLKPHEVEKWVEPRRGSQVFYYRMLELPSGEVRTEMLPEGDHALPPGAKHLGSKKILAEVTEGVFE